VRPPPLLLASASPRRADLLRAAGFTFDVLVTDVDERLAPGEPPEAYVRRVAEAKARAALGAARGRVVVAADTAVVVDEEILGKPADDAEAARMLRRLSGRWHTVLTAIAVAAPSKDLSPGVEARVEATRVEFARLEEAEIAWYVASGEPRDKAGAYAIQGLASRFVSRIDGSYGNVVGLPVGLLYSVLGDIDPRYRAGYPDTRPITESPLP